MGEPGLPLTTGEGNTARPWQCEGCDYVNVAEARRECDGCGEPKSTALMSRSGALADLSVALAERDALREQLDAQDRWRRGLEEVKTYGDEASKRIARAALGVEGPAG